MYMYTVHVYVYVMDSKSPEPIINQPEGEMLLDWDI